MAPAKEVIDSSGPSNIEWPLDLLNWLKTAANGHQTRAIGGKDSTTLCPRLAFD